MAGCRGPGRSAPAPAEPAAAVIERRAPELMAIPGVVGLAEARGRGGRTVIRVFLARDDRALRERLPATLDGYPVELEVSGEFRPMER